jgi:hypothetical protein
MPKSPRLANCSFSSLSDLTDREQAHDQAWTALCQGLLISNEFRYVD